MISKTIFVTAALAFLGLCNTGIIAQQRKSAITPVTDTPQKIHTSITPSLSADLSESSTDVEALKRRVENLEKQNRELVQALTDLKIKIEPSRVHFATSDGQATVNTGPVGPRPATEISSSSPGKSSDDTVRWSELLGEGNKIKFYGFLRLDMIFDSQRPNNSQTILFITSPDPRTGNTSNGDIAIHPRLTRFGIDYTGPRVSRLGDAKLSGKVEVDFQNGGSESRQLIRLRHGYAKLDWKQVSLLVGQTWDAVSPLFPTVNNDTLQWNAGNVGDRRPQLRLTYEPKLSEKAQLSFTGGVGLTGAIDALDLDVNGVRDGEESARPNMQGRIGFSYPLVGSGQRLSVGMSGFYGFLKTARAVVGRTSFHSQLTNIDFTLPLHTRVVFRGEGWWGRNLSDVRGGAGQGINLATGREIRGRGGWAETNLKLTSYFTVSPGFSVDDPVDVDVPANGRTRNGAFFVSNRFAPNNTFLIGADYLRWKTNFKGLQSGIDNRVNIFLQYNF